MVTFQRVVFCGFGVLATLALSTGIASATPILNYQVTTAGCFDCTIAGPFTDTSKTSNSGYTFDGVTASAGVTDAFGDAAVALGTLTRDNHNYDQSAIGNDFVLQLTFLMPVNISGGADEFIATIVGIHGQPGDLDFDNTFKTYTFTNLSGTGQFQFRVNDILSLNKNHSANLTGVIRNATFTLTGNHTDPKSDEDPSPVPEPGSLMLLGSGLVVVARQFRRRASK